jgi:hypothetical protein
MKKILAEWQLFAYIDRQPLEDKGPAAVVYFNLSCILYGLNNSFSIVDKFAFC